MKNNLDTDNITISPLVNAIKNKSMPWYRLRIIEELKKRDIVAWYMQLVYVMIIIPPRALFVFLVMWTKDITISPVPADRVYS